MEILLHFLIIFLVKGLQKEQKAQIMEYKPQSAGINLQSPQSDSTLGYYAYFFWELPISFIVVYEFL